MTNISIVIKTRGIAYLVTENGELLDWGVKRFRGDQTRDRILDHLLNIIYIGDIKNIILNELDDSRDSAASAFNWDLREHLKGKDLSIQTVNQTGIRFAFGNISRFEIAEKLSKDIPYLSHSLPRKKKLWESEDAHMLLFDAAAQLRVMKLI